jgi:hypothetical protein
MKVSSATSKIYTKIREMEWSTTYLAFVSTFVSIYNIEGG